MVKHTYKEVHSHFILREEYPKVDHHRTLILYHLTLTEEKFQLAVVNFTVQVASKETAWPGMQSVLSGKQNFAMCKISLKTIT